MILDSHQHFWNYDSRRYAWIEDSMAILRKDFLPVDLKPVLEKYNTRGCIAVQADQSEEETEFLLKLAGRHEFIKGVIGWIDLTANNIEERLNYYFENPFLKGLRHTVYDEKGEFMLDPSFQKGINLLEKFDLTYDILVFDYQLAGAIDLVKKFPNQSFVLDHLGKPLIYGEPTGKWIMNIRELATYENVFCKLSGMFTQTENFKWKATDFFPFLEIVLDAFGIDRIMYGSNWPVCLCAGSYKDTMEILLNFFSTYEQEALEKVMSRNASEFYKIQD